MKKYYLITVILLVFFNNCIYAQSDIKDLNYKFKISLNNSWKKISSLETDKKDVIKYVFKKNNSTIMIIAFKLSNIQNLADFIYTIEKDSELNIPQKNSEYTEYEYENYDGRSAIYKDLNDTEDIFYFRTKLTNSNENYAYMLRFINKSKEYGSQQENEIKTIITTFTPLF